MTDIFRKIYEYGILPIITIDDPEKAAPLAETLVAAGLPCAEVTFRTTAAEKAIRNISEKVPELLLGAGTVLTPAIAETAVKAGAKFIVTPGFNPETVQWCQEKNIPIFPGCATPSEMEQALRHGLAVVKVFPAEQIGGVEYLKAVSAPLGGLKFLPTGGIDEKNLLSYLSLDKVLACGGSWLVKKNLIESGKFDEISQIVKTSLKNMHGFELVHVGINNGSAEDAMRAAKKFEVLFGFESKAGNSSVFAGKNIELMKEGGRGSHGHLAVSCNNIVRAVSYLERNGFRFDQGSAKKDANGNLTVLYLQEEIAGFAVHLVQK